MSRLDTFRPVLATLVVAGLVAGFAWIAWVLFLRPPAGAVTGKPCEENRDCRSRQCLSVSRGSVDVRSPAGVLTIDDVALKVCTKACKHDRDCPASMSCGLVESAPVPMIIGSIDGKRVFDADTRACVPR